jgi:hypothetical protein
MRATQCRPPQRAAGPRPASPPPDPGARHTPQGPSVGASMTSLSWALTLSRSDRSWSMSLCPITDRSEVWATWDTAGVVLHVDTAPSSEMLAPCTGDRARGRRPRGSVPGHHEALGPAGSRVRADAHAGQCRGAGQGLHHGRGVRGLARCACRHRQRLRGPRAAPPCQQLRIAGIRGWDIVVQAAGHAKRLRCAGYCGQLGVRAIRAGQGRGYRCRPCPPSTRCRSR